VHSFEVIGGQKLKGEITPQGAKNEALQIISAVLLTPEKMTISNIPDILDVNLLSNCWVRWESRPTGFPVTPAFSRQTISISIICAATLFALRAASSGDRSCWPAPCWPVSARHLFPNLAATRSAGEGWILISLALKNWASNSPTSRKKAFSTLEAPQLKGCYLLLDEPSVTGTANIVMAAVMAEGTTTIYNAACEPYIQQLCKMLTRMGARISGIGSNLLNIEGTSYLGGTEHRMLPDMIEIGSFIGLAAMTQSDITIKNAGLDHLGIIPDKFRQLGIQLEFRGDDIHIPEQDIYEIQNFLDGSVLTIYDHPWPGFTPDLLSIVLVVATQARGRC
jgi:UDP-N-acetylglucosamine 1-carboxyvinyltransferase